MRFCPWPVTTLSTNERLHAPYSLLRLCVVLSRATQVNAAPRRAALSSSLDVVPHSACKIEICVRAGGRKKKCNSRSRPGLMMPAPWRHFEIKKITQEGYYCSVSWIDLSWPVGGDGGGRDFAVNGGGVLLHYFNPIVLRVRPGSMR